MKNNSGRMKAIFDSPNYSSSLALCGKGDRRTAHKVKDRETDINQMIRVFIKLLAYHKHIQTKRSTHRHTTMYNTNIVAVLDKSCCIFFGYVCRIVGCCWCSLLTFADILTKNIKIISIIKWLGNFPSCIILSTLFRACGSPFSSSYSSCLAFAFDVALRHNEQNEFLVMLNMIHISDICALK